MLSISTYVFKTFPSRTIAKHSSFFKMKAFSSNQMNWTKAPMHESDLFTASHKHRKHSSVVVKVPDC